MSISSDFLFLLYCCFRLFAWFANALVK